MKNAALWIIAAALSVGVIGGGVYLYVLEQRATEREHAEKVAAELTRKIQQLDQITSAREAAKRVLMDVLADFHQSFKNRHMMEQAGHGLARHQRRLEDIPAPPCFDLARTKSINAIRQAAPIFEAGATEPSMFLDARNSEQLRVIYIQASLPAFMSSIKSAERELIEACVDFAKSLGG